MKYQIIPPPASLSEYVRFFWILESSKPYVHRSMADGCVEMVFHYKGSFNKISDYGGEEPAPSGVQGPSTNYKIYKTTTDFGIFGVYLYPFVIPGLLSMPSTELSNTMPDFSTLFGSAGYELEEKILTANSNQDRLKLITSFLKKHLTRGINRDPGIFYTIQSVIESGGMIDINNLAERCFLSRRQFERKFKNYAGFSPKTYSRIIRFQAAADEYGNQKKSLAEIALDCGYYDQSHFTNDFKKFSGHNPKTYFFGDAEGIEWRDASD